MKTKLLILMVMAVFVNACNKDAYTTKPQLTLKSVNSTIQGTGSVLTFTFEFTDKEGDVQDTLFYSRTSKVCSLDNNSTDTTTIPNFSSTKNQKGIFEVSFPIGTATNGSITGACFTANKTDTSVFKFCLQDKAKNRSDTVTSPNITFLK